MNRNLAIELLGKTGEKIVSNHLSELGYKVTHSINNFDNQKDLIVEGRTVEVKTEQPYVQKNAITIRRTQVKKCRSVDALYFVLLPPLIDPNYKWGGVLLEVDPESFECRPYTTKSGIQMVEIPIDQPSVRFIKKLSTEEKMELLKYASSAYDRKKLR